MFLRFNILIFLFFFFANLSAQSSLTPNNVNDNKEADKEERREMEFHNPYRFSGLSFHYNISNYPFFFGDFGHAMDLFNYDLPDWPNINKSIQHEMRHEVMVGSYISKHLFDRNSFYYGTIFVGLYYSLGNRINYIITSEYRVFSDSASLTGAPVTDLDTSIVRQKEYVQNTQDIGISLAYMLSSPIDEIVVAEIGLGAAVMQSFTGKIIESSIYSKNVVWRNQFGRHENYNLFESNKKVVKTSEHSTFVRLFVPAIFSYKFGRYQNFGISSYMMIGMELQQTYQKNTYVYPIYSLGIGLKHFFRYR